MSVRYKFKSEAIFSQILFNGIYISLDEVKKEIFRQRRLGKSENIDLMISNSESGEKYTSDDTLIPKNTSLVVIRIPKTVNSSHPKKYFNKITSDSQNPPRELNKFSSNIKSIDLTSMKATEEEKIFAMMMQSTMEYKNFAQNPILQPPSNYVCRKCHVPGHFIRNCPLNAVKSHRYDPKQRKESNKMTGIPMSMRNQNENRQFYGEKIENSKIPSKLFCQLCNDVFRQPVITPCCKSTYCNECIVNVLIQNEYNCVQCDEKYVFPGDLKDDLETIREIERLRMVGSDLSVKIQCKLTV